MTAQISEIFKSIQGEGKYIGLPQLFIRFFQCHMHCSWCDTPDSIGDGKKDYQSYSLEQLKEEVRPLMPGCHSVSLTGGEPLLQVDFIRLFLPYIREAGLKVYLETSGVLYQALSQIVDQVDIVSMDLKLPSSTGCRASWQEHAAFFDIARRKDCFLKVVVSKTTSSSDVQKAIELVKNINPQIPFYIQPNHFELSEELLVKCLEFQQLCSQSLKDVRIVPQMHKFLKIR